MVAAFLLQDYCFLMFLDFFLCCTLLFVIFIWIYIYISQTKSKSQIQIYHETDVGKKNVVSQYRYYQGHVTVISGLYGL